MAGLGIFQIMTWSLCSVAFYLIFGSTKCEMLVLFLKEILDTCQNAGLVVVATMFDIGAKNIKDFKQLGVSEKTPFFRFRDQDIAAGFDPSHPCKCTHNLFLKQDVTNVWLCVVN